VFGFFGGMCLGYNGGVVAGGIIYLQKDFPLITISEKSVFIFFNNDECCL
jgi:hypothetical protein